MSSAINMGKVMSAHAKFKRAHRELVANEERRAGEFGVQYVSQNPTFKPRTGNLQKQTDYKLFRLANRSVIRLINRAKYANTVEFGSRPHRIQARRARTLRFVAKSGAIVFRRGVNHPGTRPYKFLYRATTATGRQLEQALRSGMTRIAARF